LQPLLHALIGRVVFEAALNAPGKVGERLTKVTKNDVQAWEPIEESK